MALKGTRDFVKHSFFKVSPEWRRLRPGERDQSKSQFADVVDEFSDRLAMASYSLVGTRGDVDFMLWKISPTLEAITEMLAELNHTVLGKYLSMPHSYLSLTRPSHHVDRHHNLGQEGAAAPMQIIGSKCLCVYPFVRTPEWYRLQQSESQRMLEEHFAIVRRYSGVTISTAYSFGLDDQEFVLGFETDDVASVLELVADLRGLEGRRYTLRDTPSFTCISEPLKACLDGLG